MKRKLFYIGLLALSLLGVGCSDFLEEYSRDQVYASNTADLEEVLIGNGYMKSENGTAPIYLQGYYDYLFVLDDDAEENVLLESTSSMSGGSSIAFYRTIYTWQKKPYYRSFSTDPNVKDETIDKLYAHIAYVNTIIDYLDEFPNDPIEQKRQILGESQFLRGAYYLMLSNLYGWAYDVKNGGKDLSVPLKTTSWVVEDKLPRATVGEVYKVIEQDLKGACENLRGVEQKVIYRTNQLASRLLLSRLYLYMERYDEVIEQCDSALNMGVELWDLNTFKQGKPAERDYLHSVNNPEIIFTMGHSSSAENISWKSGYTGLEAYSVSENLILEYQSDNQVEDLRLGCYFYPHQTASSRYGLVKNCRFDVSWVYPNIFETFLLRSVEIYLNKAEAQAMKGDLAGAISTLQPLLKTRYATGKLPQLASLNEEDLVTFIRSERRRELCFEGHRWQDLRRYAVNSKHQFKTAIYHTIYDVGTPSGGRPVGTYKLNPYGEDEGWIMPFLDEDIAASDGALENPDRPERSMIDFNEE